LFFIKLFDDPMRLLHVLFKYKMIKSLTN